VVSVKQRSGLLWRVALLEKLVWAGTGGLIIYGVKRLLEKHE